MAKTTAKLQHGTWPIADLKPHPRQDTLFTPPTADELPGQEARLRASEARLPPLKDLNGDAA